MAEINAVPNSEIALTCTIRAPARVHLGEPVPLKFELRNRAMHPVHVQMRNTPLEGFLGIFLNVTGPQGEVNYAGPMVKRGAPGADEYLRINGLAKRSRTVDLARVYAFTKPGKYRIQFTGELHDVSTQKPPRTPEQFQRYAVSCGEVVVEVVGK